MQRRVNGLVPNLSSWAEGDNKGIMLVDADAVETPRALEKWVELSLEHVLKLPIKVKKATKGKGAVKK